MQDIIDLIVQVGVLPAIIGYMMFDQSKKMTAVELSNNATSMKLGFMDNTLRDLNKQLERVEVKLESIDRHIEECKKK